MTVKGNDAKAVEDAIAEVKNMIDEQENHPRNGAFNNSEQRDSVPVDAGTANDAPFEVIDWQAAARESVR